MALLLSEFRCCMSLLACNVDRRPIVAVAGARLDCGLGYVIKCLWKEGKETLLHFFKIRYCKDKILVHLAICISFGMLFL
jgi:hypothetical protein